MVEEGVVDARVLAEPRQDDDFPAVLHLPRAGGNKGLARTCLDAERVVGPRRHPLSAGALEHELGEGDAGRHPPEMLGRLRRLDHGVGQAAVGLLADARGHARREQREDLLGRGVGNALGKWRPARGYRSRRRGLGAVPVDDRSAESIGPVVVAIRRVVARTEPVDGGARILQVRLLPAQRLEAVLPADLVETLPQAAERAISLPTPLPVQEEDEVRREPILVVGLPRRSLGHARPRLRPPLCEERSLAFGGAKRLEGAEGQSFLFDLLDHTGHGVPSEGMQGSKVIAARATRRHLIVPLCLLEAFGKVLQKNAAVAQFTAIRQVLRAILIRGAH